MSDELEAALADLNEAREKLEAVRATLTQVLNLSQGDQAVVEKAKARLERIDAEVASVERAIGEVARQVVGA
jgi:chromosome segregation ATPase